MLKSLSCKLTTYIENNSDIKNSDDLEKINYSLQAILNETFKIIILTILFLLLGKINYFFFSMILLFSIRILSGGYHANTTIQCLLLTTLFFLTTSVLAPMLPKLNTFIYITISLFSIILVYFRTPCSNSRRPIISKKRSWFFKLISTFFVAFWVTILLFFTKDIGYINCGFTTILLQLLQLIPIKKGA